MSDELAKLSLKDLIAQGKLGQLDLKRKKEAEILKDKEEILREKEAQRKLKQEERLKDKEERKKLFQEQRARKKEERIELEKQELLIKKIRRSSNQSPRTLRIKPLTPQQQLDCDRLMRLYDFDIGKVAMELWVSPVSIQVYWLNKSKEKKVK